VCLVCAGLWTGFGWRGRHGPRETSCAEAEHRVFVGGSVRVRTHGDGIEGRPMTATGGSARAYRRRSKRYLPSPWTGTPPIQDDVTKDAYRDDDDEEYEQQQGLQGDEDVVLVDNRQSRTTLALLQTFHAQTRFWLSRLAPLLPPPSSASGEAMDEEGDGRSGAETVVHLAPRDVLELELSPLSGLDANFVEWLTEEYGAGAGAGASVRVSVRRSWRDLFGLVFAVGGTTSPPVLS
jgi:hypothetical protein